MPPLDDGPSPLNWEDYQRDTAAKFKTLLESGSGEKQMQTFLEQHPPMVPGAFPEFSGHGAWPYALITQPPLKGFGHRIPDFMWITRNSGAVQPVLIEIEDPAKPWLAGKGDPRPSHQLTQALNQIRQWSEWLEDNHDLFFKAFGIPPEWRQRSFRPIYFLIYGRKEENPRELAKLRQYLHDEKPNLHLLTYDHLSPNRDHDGYLCVKGDGQGKYEVVAMPATARLHPNDPESWKCVSGRQQVIEAHESISEERKRFLVNYVARCDMWAEAYDDTRQKVLEQAHAELGDTA
jgi:hypothetical protein